MNVLAQSANFAQSSVFWLKDFDQLWRLAPMWALTGGAVAVLLGAIIIGRRPLPIAMLALIAAIGAAVACNWVGVAETPWAGLSPQPERMPMLLVDNFSVFFTLLIALFLSAVIGLWIFGYESAAPRTDMHHNAPEFFSLLLISALGMVLMVSTTNLLMILIAVEMASLPSYALAGFDKRHRLGAEASLKYVLFGGITSAVMIYGASLLYGWCGSLELGVIARAVAAGDATLLPAIGLFGLLVGVGFKISAVPFHFWCPDVFEGAAIEVTTWLSVASKAAGLGLFIRIISGLAAAEPPADVAWSISLTVGLFAALTCTVGNLSALHQTNIKRLLAYSSIAHAGYMLMAGAILANTRPQDGHPAFTALAAYLIVYLFMNLGAFGCAAMVYWATGKETLDAFNGLGRRHPFLAIAMTVCLVSLVGLPPLGGFAAKYWLLVNVWNAGLIWLVVVAVLNTALSLYYYLKVVREMYLSDDGQPALSAPLGGLGLAALSVVVILWTGTLAVGTLRNRAEDFSRYLYVGAARAPATAVISRGPSSLEKLAGALAEKTGKPSAVSAIRNPQSRHGESPSETAIRNSAISAEAPPHD